MRSKLLLAAIVFSVAACGCSMVQSIVKSSVPYTASLTIPASANTKAEQSVTGTATSLDQNFSKSGNNARKVSGVHMVSAMLQVLNPPGFNIGNLSSVRIYVSKPGDNTELPVASQTAIPANAGNNISLNIDNTHFLDDLVRQPNMKVRIVYQLRNGIDASADLKVTLGMTAYPGK